MSMFFMFGADKKHCAELLLEVCAQRGSLCHLLEWVTMALKAPVPQCSIDRDLFASVLKTLKPSSTAVDLPPDLPLYKAAILLLTEVAFLFFTKN